MSKSQDKSWNPGAAVAREYLAPWGAGYPLAGQLYGCPSTPRRVYSCSMPNQMQCSFTCSITFLQFALWLVSEQQERKQSAVTPLVAELSTRGREGSETFYLQAIGCIWGPRRAPVCWGRGWTGPWTWRRGPGTCRCWSPRPGRCWSHRSSTQGCLEREEFKHEEWLEVQLRSVNMVIIWYSLKTNATLNKCVSVPHSIGTNICAAAESVYGSGRSRMQ